MSDVTTPVSSIFREFVGVLKTSEFNLTNRLPMFKNVKDKLYRKRNKALGVAKVGFKNQDEVIVPEKSYDFLIADFINHIKIEF